MDGGCINGNPKMEATAEGRLYNHSPRLACLPRDTGGARNYRRRAVVERCFAYGYKESAPRIAPRGAS